MSVAQQLYEGVDIGKEGTVGLISYMRTDSTRLSSAIVGEAKNYIISNYGEKYSNGGRTFEKKKAGSQDAHEAVRPSSIYRDPKSLKKYLSKDQIALYEMIWNRTVASQMKQAIYEVTTVKFNSNDKLFRTSGNIMKFDGFMKVWTTAEKQSELPEFKIGEVLKPKKIEKNQHFTKSKARYTEASLVKALEEDGIGRPSTYSCLLYTSRCV